MCCAVSNFSQKLSHINASASMCDPTQHQRNGTVVLSESIPSTELRRYEHTSIILMTPSTIRYDTIDEFNVDSKAEYTG